MRLCLLRRESYFYPMQIKATDYTIYLGTDIFDQIAAFLDEKYPDHSLVILVDDNTFENCLPLFVGKVERIADAEVIEIPSGEANKTLTNIAHIWDGLTGLGADRNTLLVNLGGGVVSDMGGFAAATYKRGIDYINIPTTLLAMVDASVGGKTGFDFNSIKNQIGVFTNPQAVFIQPVFLETLPKRQLLSGFAEMLKHGLIADENFWLQLKAVNTNDIDELAGFIPRCIEIKNTIVTEDPLDKGERQKLNFGHTIGHALESYYLETDDELLHGEAIAIGMVAEGFIAVEKGLLTLAALKEIEEFLTELFEVPELDADDEESIILFIQDDKKNSRDTIYMSLIEGIGFCQTHIPVSVDEIKKALHYCKALSY